MDEEYTFPPRRINGVLGKVTFAQLLTIVIAIALPWLGIRSGSVGAFAALAVAGCLLVWLAFTRVGGRHLTAWCRPVVAVMWSRLRGLATYRGAVFAPGSLRERMDLPGDLVHLRMVSAPHTDGRTRIGLVVDDKAGTVTAALLTEGTPIVLEESTEQAGRLNDWEAVMESTCDSDSAVVRWQLLVRSMPDTTNTAQQYYLDRVQDPEQLAAQALRELVAHAAPSGQRHEVFFVVSFGLAGLASEVRAAGGGDEALGVVVVERLAEIQRQMADARIPTQGWLTPGHYAAVIHTQFDPDSLGLYDPTGHSAEIDPRTAGPSATERQWALFLHDSAVSSTVWVHELPRRPVTGSWLSPLLQQTDLRRSITLVAEPLDTARAEKSITSQRLAAAGSIYLKERHGLVVDARTQKELDAAQRLDDELAGGEGYFRYSMFVCCSAPDADQLRRAVASVRRKLTRARCSSMVLFGEQDQAFFAAALPLARGLAPMRGVTGS